MVKAWQKEKNGITPEFHAETQNDRVLGIGGLFTLRIDEEDSVFENAVNQGGTTGIKPSRPYLG